MERNALESLESKHRKEKKELQAQIQSLKKTAKNDKTKKKELSAEITRLEMELESQHKQELEAFQIVQSNTSEVSDGDDNSTVTTKISKAQKRRDKKVQQERERDEQIRLQEKDNENGPRNIEIQTICTKLKKYKLKIFPIPSDGDCLYKAVAHQLASKQDKSLDIADLRKSTATYIIENKNDFLPFMSNHDTRNILSDEEFKDYCDKIANTKVWGGQLELSALSKLLKCPITIIQATGPESIQQGEEFENPPLVITYHRHMYSLGEHYNSTCSNEDNE